MAPIIGKPAPSFKVRWMLPDPVCCPRLCNVIHPARSSIPGRRQPTDASAWPPAQGTAVVNGQLKTISLDDFKGKYLVLFF